MYTTFSLILHWQGSVIAAHLDELLLWVAIMIRLRNAEQAADALMVPITYQEQEENTFIACVP
jgi:hypothetical protein